MTEFDSSMYHSGHRELQDRFDGRRTADALEKIHRHPQFTEHDRTFIEKSEFFFLATACDASVDCSFKGGPPGFVRVTGPTTLEWSDVDGNSMYRSLGNILKSPRIGLLFIRFGASPRRLRVNGLCTLRDGTEEQGGKLIARLEADEIFPNCARYIPDMTMNAASPYHPDATGTGAKPDWKDAEGLRESLPENDPHRSS